MSRSVAPQLMSNPVQGMQDGNNTSASAALYSYVYMGTYLMGLVRSWTVTENGSNTPMNFLGTDWLEDNIGIRQSTYSVVRNPVRGRQVRDIMALIYSTVGDVDFRKLPVDLRLLQCFLSASGGSKFEYRWRTLRGCRITTCTDEMPDPNSNQLETISGWCKGQQFDGDNVVALSPASALFGSSTDLNNFSQVAPIAAAF